LDCVISSVQRLLSAMCDCTVHLDSDLCIARPCHKLAGFLLRSSTGSASVAKPFLDLLTPDDRPRFTSYIEEGILAQRLSDIREVPAHPLHLSLLDVNNGLVPVEVFSSFIQDAEGSPVHLVGIKQEEEELYQQRENAHPAKSHCDSNSVPENSMRNSPDNLRHSQGMDIQCITENSVCSSSDIASSLSSDSVADIVCSCSSAMIWKDATCCNMPITHYTTGFSMLLGPSPMEGMNFFDLFAEDSTAAFSRFLTRALNHYVVSEADDVVNRCPVRLHPPWLRRQRITIRAQVTVTFQESKDNDLDEENMDICPAELVVATFHSLSWHQGRSRPTKTRNRIPRRANRLVPQSPFTKPLLQL